MLDRHVRELLANKRIVLASVSPSRKEVFEKNIKLNVAIWPSTFDSDHDNFPREDGELEVYIQKIAQQKVNDIADQLMKVGDEPFMIIGAHTVVTVNGKVQQKPRSREEAKIILKRLADSDEPNIVSTATVIKFGPSYVGKTIKLDSGSTAELPNERCFVDHTKVYFRKGITDEHIAMYVATGEPMEVAGAYCIQGFGSALVERIEGNYFNVKGLPVHKFCKELNDIFRDVDLDLR